MSATINATATAVLLILSVIHAHICRPRGTRTHNQRIKSPLLCQLS